MVPNITSDPVLMPIAQEWLSRKHELSEWAWNHLVNRTDIWGQYTGKPNSRWKALTMPRKEKRGEDQLTIEHLEKHFGSLKRHHLLGLHAQSFEGTCRWFAIDLDLHDETTNDAEDIAAQNFLAATAWWDRLQLRGLDPLLYDSNGKGGFHLVALLSQAYPIAQVYQFAQEVIADWQNWNLHTIPETFPKSGEMTEKGNGNWLRLPGLHHTHNHFSRVWSGDDWLDEPWLTGNEAITQMLNTVPGRF